MGYVYADYRPYVFTEEGQITFLRIRDAAGKLIEMSGAASCHKLMQGVCGDTWETLACIDRLVEIGELIEIPNPASKFTQHRIFIHPYRP